MVQPNVAIISKPKASSTKKKKSEKPYINRTINLLLGPMRYLKLGPYKHDHFTLEECIEAARRCTGLNDFGDEESLANFRYVLNFGFQKSQKYSNLGYVAARTDMILLLSSRLKKLEYIKRHPEILDIPVRSPVFVFGLPRTGTTLLHRLLSLDPAVRSPLFWELNSSVPYADMSDSAEVIMNCRRKRRQFAIQTLAKSKLLWGDSLTYIHELGADLPEECLLAMREDVCLQPYTLLSVYMNYDNFFKNTNWVKAYAYYKKTLQLLSYQVHELEDPCRWVLKCPFHLMTTKGIAAVYPDAKLIWTHRDPSSAVASVGSLLNAFHSSFFDKSTWNKEMMGKPMKEAAANALRNAPQNIAESGLPCCHITYQDLVTDPISTVQKIYKYYGWEFTPEYNKILNAYLQANLREREALKMRRGCQKLNCYEPKDFGLTEEELRSGDFKHYVTEYNVPLDRL